MDALPSLADHWWWLILALALATAEMLLPGVFLIWLGAAALVTGVATLLFGIGLPVQFGIFAISAVAAVYAGRRWFATNPIETSDPLLNDRTARLLGEIVVVATAIDGGTGKVRVGDSLWIARGPDAAVGERVRVIGVKDGALLVEKLTA